MITEIFEGYAVAREYGNSRLLSWLVAILQVVA
jgi:hypothetical protein